MTDNTTDKQLLVALCVLNIDSEPIAELAGVDIHAEGAVGRIARWIKPWDPEFTEEDFRGVRYDCEIQTGGEMYLAYGKWLTYNTMPQPEVEQFPGWTQ